MPGPIDINPDVIKPETAIAYKDENGNWRAGSDAKGYEQGQFVDSEYAKQATSQRKRTNLVKANMRRRDETEEEAREHINEIQEELDEEKKEPEPDKDRIRDLRQRLHGSE